MSQPDYGLDAPGVIRNLAIAGVLCMALGYLALTSPNISNSITFTLDLMGLVCCAEAVWMVMSSRSGKLKARDQLLDGLRLAPDARVLDVGCGHGLLLIGAAKRTPSGRAVGIDLWSQVDQKKNAAEHTLRNAELEGVAERVEVRDGDMRKLPFGDAEFDAVVASLSIHNIPDAPGRADAVREIARVLKPGGKVALLDFKCTAEYADTLRASGLTDVARSGLSFSIFPPVRVVTGRKP